MKCENCGTELVGAAIVCRQCNHNNAQGRVSQWRARRTGELKKPSSPPVSEASAATSAASVSGASSTRSISPLPEPPKTESPKAFSRNSKPLAPIKPAAMPFEPKIQITPAPPKPTAKVAPAASFRAEAQAEAQSDNGQEPPWRAQLKEKVKQARERRTVGATALESEPDEVELDPNPLVESALKRIQWAKHRPPATEAVKSAPRIIRHGSGAAALAAEEFFEPAPMAEGEAKTGPQSENVAVSEAELKDETKPAARTTPAVNNPLLARKPATAPVNRAETTSLPTRPAPPTAKAPATPKPAEAEARIAIPPAAKATAVTPATGEAVPENKSAEPKPRVTGEIKTPAPTPQAEKSQAAPIASAIPPRTAVATEVVGLPRTTGSLKAAMPRPAKLWVRTLAGACDFELVAVAFLPLFASYATLNTSLGRESFAIMFFLLATLTFCYQLLMITVAGRTTGMACLKLKLVNVAGGNKPISNTQKFARAVAATAAFLFPPLNLIVMQANEHRYSLPDLLSGTTLVEK